MELPAVKMTRLTLSLASAFTLTWLAGCAANPATGGSDFVLMSEEQEIELGEQYRQQVLQKFKIYPDDPLQDYVNFVGQRLAAVSERSHLNFTFTVLDDDAVNAFTLPGGHVYITRGILAHMGSEAELAAVLGHEIGHTTARHIVRQHSGSTMLGTLGAIASVVTGSSAAAGAANYAGAALVQGYSRKHELEADALSARYLARVGYEPDALIEVIAILKQQEKFEIERAKLEDREPKIYHGFFASHPDADKRLYEAVAEAKAYGTGNPAMSRPTFFLSQLEGIRFGKTDTGVLRGDTFYHPTLGIKINFPDGWALQNRGSLIAMSPQEDAVLRVGAFGMGNNLTPQSFLVRELKVARLRDGRDVTISGMDAYIGIADETKSPFGRRPVRYAAVFDDRNGQVYVFEGAGKYDQTSLAADRHFIATIFSLDYMSPGDHGLAKPPSLHLVTADGETTMEALAVETPIPDYPLQKLRLLNGMYPDGQPEPGQIIKTVR